MMSSRVMLLWMQLFGSDVKENEEHVEHGYAGDNEEKSGRKGKSPEDWVGPESSQMMHVVNAEKHVHQLISYVN